MSEAEIAFYRLGLDETDFLLMKQDLLDAIRNATRELLESFNRKPERSAIGA